MRTARLSITTMRTPRNTGTISMPRPYISVVIPTRDEEKNVRRVITGIRQILKGYRSEIIIVDSSHDRTPQIAKSMGATVIREELGKGAALITGFTKARGDIVISMDADLSNKPKELLLLISGIEAGYDICMGSRFMAGGGSEDMTFTRRIGNKFFVWLVNALYRSHYTDMCYGYRSFASGVFQKLSLVEQGFGIETEISIKSQKAGLKVLEVPSYEKRRVGGVGKLRTFQDGWNILRTILKNL
ncbi:MAG: glycosyltransferase family 2 protein [Candidatus Micrarchaeota archaeon]|nr:glycosyltransferase family 2 protein [Candidatus Micrarchaeota archaeon]